MVLKYNKKTEKDCFKEWLTGISQAKSKRIVDRIKREFGGKINDVTALRIFNARQQNKKYACPLEEVFENCSGTIDLKALDEAIAQNNQTGNYESVREM